MKKITLISTIISSLLFIVSCINNESKANAKTSTALNKLNTNSTTNIAASSSWEMWKQSFYNKAVTKGISKQTMQTFLDNVTFYPKAIKSDKSQSEFKKFIWQYLDRAVSSSKITKGKEKYNSNSALLIQITNAIGVAPQFLVAIWGVESNYGSYTGNVPLISSMATLAYEGRRRNFFEAQLITILKLIEAGDISSFDVKGSWAGGMGHTQFIPTSYVSYAVDFDNDGRRDLWNQTDALASTANYFIKKGWKTGFTWGREVNLPLDFNYLYANDKNDFKSLTSWKNLGVKTVNNFTLPTADIIARLYVPAGASGPKFLLYKNFDVIKKYNNSDSYALAVSLLADQIVGKPSIKTNWPIGKAKKLTKDDISLLQKSLNNKGFNAGTVDSRFGSKTKRAIQYYQQSKEKQADGFLTNDLFNEIVGQ